MPSMQRLQQLSEQSRRSRVIEYRERAAQKHKDMLASFYRGWATQKECDEALDDLVKWDKELKLVMGAEK